MKKYFLLMFITIITIFSFFKLNSNQVVTVETFSPRVTTVYNSITVKGTLVQTEEDNISINQNGVITKTQFENYDYVNKGDLIMQITATDELSDISKDSLILLLNQNSNIIIDTYNQEIIDVFSNVDGRIMNIPTVGTTVIASVPFLSISSNDSISALVEVPERYILKVKEGQSTSVKGTSFNGTINGIVSDVKPYAKASFDILGNSSEVKIEATIDIENQKNLIIGASVEADIVVDRIENAMVIPYEAIFQENRQEFVYIAEGGKAVKRAIETGYELTNEIQVISGLLGDEIIILDTDLQENCEVFYDE